MLIEEFGAAAKPLKQGYAFEESYCEFAQNERTMDIQRKKFTEAITANKISLAFWPSSAPLTLPESASVVEV